MKRKIKRYLVFIVVLFLLITAIKWPVEASISENDTSSITLTGLEAGVTAYLYQLTTVTYNYTSNQPQDPEYVWVEEIRDWISSNYQDYINTTDGSVTDAFNIEDLNDSSVATFYSQLIAQIEGRTISGLSPLKSATTSGTATYPVDEDSCTESVTFSGLEMGTYLVLVENGYRVYTPVVQNLVPEYDDSSDEWVLNTITVTCKSTTPSIEKTIDGASESGSYSTEDILTYIITADIPNYEEGSLSTTYIISDTLRIRSLPGYFIDKSIWSKWIS